MYRYSSLTRYKGYTKSLKNVKDMIVRSPISTKDNANANLKNCQTSEPLRISKELPWRDRILTIDVNNPKKSELLRKIKNILSYAVTKVEDTNKALNELQQKIEEKKHTYKSKSIRSRYAKWEIQKFCENLKNKIAKERAVILGVTGLTIADSKSDAGQTDPIPDAPPIPDLSGEAASQLNALGEPTFESLGLGGYSPVGLVQSCFEYVHVTLGVEWWVAIVIGTIIIRSVLFPLVIIAQRNAAKMNNYLPQMQTLQLKISEARQTGNQIDAARYSQELMLFMREKQLNPLKNMIVPLAQMPVFISFFMALREMSNVPVESLRTGGLWWFQDLTLPDQYFLLPIITSATLWATIELGTDAAKLSSQNMQLMKYVLRGLPLVILPFTVNFPGAILCYWVSTNFISLVQVGILRIPKVRNYFKIEPLQKFNPENLPMKPKSFREGLKDSWTNVKITKELEERNRLDEMQFQRAGKGPIVKTYKYDPTKQMEPTKSTPISAKKRD